ncbi:MAG: RluA family pseudouridine synthase [Clostridia bacterium]|nr:RluA family pseudouridine synthase [Clostridia bacterium]
MEYQVNKTRDGVTVLEVLRGELKLSRGHLKHLKFMENGIVVNGKPVTVRYILREGDRLVVATEDTTPHEKILPVSLPLPVAYEDEDVVVPDKPANMPTHPSHNHYDDTVANALAFRYERLGIPFVFRPVNRLDRNTSGLLLIARNRVAASALFRAMQKGEIRKRYLAILCGVPQETEGLIDTYMRRTAESIIVRENCREGEGGDRALTRYRVLCQKNGHALVLASPLTGRTHQLRVHFAGLGCPILGDDLYGTPSDRIERHALHSCALSFPAPTDGKRIEVSSPLPQDMEAAARQLFGETLPSTQTLLELLNKNP